MPALLLTADLFFCSKVAAAAARQDRHVETALGIEAFWEKVAAHQVDLVILDLATPGLDTRELVPRLRGLAPARRGPPAVVAFGAHVHEAKLSTAAEAGCDLVLSRGQFNAQVDEILSRFLVRS